MDSNCDPLDFVPEGPSRPPQPCWVGKSQGLTNHLTCRCHPEQFCRSIGEPSRPWQVESEQLFCFFPFYLQHTPPCQLLPRLLKAVLAARHIVLPTEAATSSAHICFLLCIAVLWGWWGLGYHFQGNQYSITAFVETLTVLAQLLTYS